MLLLSFVEMRADDENDDDDDGGDVDVGDDDVEQTTMATINW